MSFRLGPDGKPVEVDSSFDERKQRTKPPQNEPATQPPPGRSDAGKTQPPGVDLFGHIVGGQQDNMRPGRMPVSEEPPTRPMRRAKAEMADEPDSNFNAAEPKTQINFGSAGVSGTLASQVEDEPRRARVTRSDGLLQGRVRSG